MGFSEIHTFPHTRYIKDVNFGNLKFDGIAIDSKNNKLCLFQIKSNRKPSAEYLKEMGMFSEAYGVECLWINVIDRKPVEIYGN